MQTWSGRRRAGLCLCMVALTLACDDDSKSEKDDEDKEDVGVVADPTPEGTEALASGDLSAASESYQSYAEEDGGTAVGGHTGLAYLSLLEEDFDGALLHLEKAREESSKTEAQEIDLRRALVQLRAGRLPDYPDGKNPEAPRLPGATTFAKQSDLPQGWLMVGEIALTEGERAQAVEYFEKAADTGDGTGDIAQQYLSLLESDNATLRNLSEAVANWSVGMSSPPISVLKEQAVEDFETLGEGLVNTAYGTPEQMLLWAGRAASIGDTVRGRTILKWAKSITGEQAWRYAATDAILYCAEGNVRKCKSTFNKVEAMEPPAEGYRDARATAALLLGTLDAQAAEGLIGNEAGTAVGARVLADVQPCKSKESTTAEGLLGEYIQTSSVLEELCSIE